MFEERPSKAEFEAAIEKLKDLKIVEELSQEAKKRYNADLYLCSKRDGNEEYELQFLIDETGLLNASQMMGIIEKRIGYSNVVVQPKSLFQDSMDQNFSKVVLYASTNAEQIRKILDWDLAGRKGPPATYFFEPSLKAKSLDDSSETVLERALRLMELAVQADPQNLEKIVQKAKELGSPKDKLDN